jgi:hypothetical protein
LALVFAFLNAEAKPPLEKRVVYFDGIPWSFPASDRTVVIGDLHGDIEAFINLLSQRGLVDKKQNWIGGKTNLVVMGDVFSKGPHSKPIMDLLIKLKFQAVGHQGGLHFILGNNELKVIRKRFDDTTKKDIEDYGSIESMREAVSTGLFGKWLSQRNSVAKVGRTLFVHAGVDKWLLEFDPGEINSTVRAWIRHFQTDSDAPENNTRWAIMKEGPLRTRVLDPENPTLRKKLLDKILDLYDVDRIVVGHVSVPKIFSKHPKYGKKVVNVDTGISIAKSGVPSVLEITSDGRNERLEAYHYKRSKKCFGVFNPF